MIGKKCLQCGKIIEKKKNFSISRFENVKYCSASCASKNKTHHKGSENSNWIGGKLNKICIVCSKDFQCWNYQENRKCCSLKCLKEYQQTREFKETMSKINLGKTLSVETKQKISDAQIGQRMGEENANWKGDDIGYRAMHEWIIREKGTPDTCEHCGLTGSIAKKRLVWANKSHEYKRDINDWMRLCYRCHRIYDFPNEKHPR